MPTLKASLSVLVPHMVPLHSSFTTTIERRESKELQSTSRATTRLTLTLTLTNKFSNEGEDDWKPHFVITGTLARYKKAVYLVRKALILFIKMRKLSRSRRNLVSVPEPFLGDGEVRQIEINSRTSYVYDLGSDAHKTLNLSLIYEVEDKRLDDMVIETKSGGK